MRLSSNQYRLPDGRLVLAFDSSALPDGSILWQGFDYTKQEWVFEGKPDTRSLTELQTAIKARAGRE